MAISADKKGSGRAPYNLVIFDFDRTLAKLELPWDRLKEEVRAFVTRESLNVSFTGSNTISGGYTALAELTDRKRAAALRRELSELNDRYERMATIALLVDKKLYEVLRKKYRVVIISNNGKAVIFRGMKEHGLAADAIISRDDVTRLKPNKEGIEKVLAQFHTGPANAVFIGDGTYDERAATAAGVDFIGVGSGLQSSYATINDALRALLNERK